MTGFLALVSEEQKRINLPTSFACSSFQSSNEQKHLNDINCLLKLLVILIVHSSSSLGFLIKSHIRTQVLFSTLNNVSLSYLFLCFMNLAFLKLHTGASNAPMFSNTRGENYFKYFLVY